MKSSPSVAGSRFSSGQAFVPIVLVVMHCFLPRQVSSATAATSDSQPSAADTTWQTVLDASEPLDPPILNTGGWLARYFAAQRLERLYRWARPGWTPPSATTLRC